MTHYPLGRPRQQVEVLTRKDIEKEYVLVKAKLSLLQKEDSFATRLSSKAERDEQTDRQTDKQTLSSYLSVCAFYYLCLCVCYLFCVSVSVAVTVGKLQVNVIFFHEFLTKHETSLALVLGFTIRVLSCQAITASLSLSLSLSLSGPFVSVDEVVALLVQVGLFDTAIDTALRFNIPLMPIFESLAAR